MKKCVVMFILFIAALVSTIYVEQEEKITNIQDLVMQEKVNSKDIADEKELSTDFERQVSSYVHLVDYK